MTGPEILTITGAAAALAVTPGPETILTIRLSSLRRKAGLVYALGTATGTVIWMVLALTGVSALLTVYPAAVQLLKIGGGLYLCLLGVLAGRQALRLRRELRATETTGEPAEVSPAPSTGSDSLDGPVSEIAHVMESTSWGHLRSFVSYRRGIISSLSNPKVGLFFLAILPTLVPASPTGIDYTVLVALILGVLLSYQLVLACVASLAASAMAHRSADFFIEAASTVILLIIGIAVIAIPI
ncbi:Threonine/homoserine/homoserine lactone efflux protein [Brevibacterium siliguriense]|uniref:Threonine/homoserine/homoserine lactone efflux protein n=1 Tax=Brevibacterium siliguriense TaxID=1136497 RepID=A0A1H1QZ77_9MICO|nr:LysE family transporter [Brevibacterium siliguriense]SDS28797.1 Threonine/homoserine/homoserine lactone efflux protein [Brevibacterium siliguriense]